MDGLKKTFLAAVMIALGVYLLQNAFRPDKFETEAERALAAAKAQAELMQADARVRAENAAKLAAKAEEDRAIEQKAWNSAFSEDYQAERDARWRQLTSPH
jgi:hypothetical protein